MQVLQSYMYSLTSLYLFIYFILGGGGGGEKVGSGALFVLNTPSVYASRRLCIVIVVFSCVYSLIYHYNQN